MYPPKTPQTMKPRNTIWDKTLQSVLQYYWTTVIQNYRTTKLQNYSTTVLLNYSTTVPQKLQHCNPWIGELKEEYISCDSLWRRERPASRPVATRIESQEKLQPAAWSPSPPLSAVHTHTSVCMHAQTVYIYTYMNTHTYSLLFRISVNIPLFFSINLLFIDLINKTVSFIFWLFLLG